MYLPMNKCIFCTPIKEQKSFSQYNMNDNYSSPVQAMYSQVSALLHYPQASYAGVSLLFVYKKLDFYWICLVL
jgi:hypothetical protein